MFFSEAEVLAKTERKQAKFQVVFVVAVCKLLCHEVFRLCFICVSG